jgi:trk system potassium uptake protein TrkH
MAIAQQHQTISSRRQRDMLLTALDLVLAITAVAAIATLILEHGWRAGNHPVDLAKLHAASWLIAGVFAGERFFRLGISHNRSRYARDNWIDFMLIGMAVVAVGVVHRLGDRPLGLNGQATLSAGAMYMLICQLYILGVLLLRAMTLNLRFTESGIHPTWLLILSFAALCLIGSGLLMLPVAIPEPTSPNYLRLDYPDALFTAVSATCVTGLVTRDIGLGFTTFGQAVILSLIQLGGLGIMLFGTVLAGLVGKSLTVRGSRTMAAMLMGESYGRMARMASFIVTTTLILEAAGAFLMYPMFANAPGINGQPNTATQAAWMSAFHSISSFCNAGFSLYGRNMLAGVNQSAWSQPLRDSWQIMGVMAPLIILGGLGFPVISDCGAWIKARIFKSRGQVSAWENEPPVRSHLSLHSRLALWTTIILIILGAAVLMLVEVQVLPAGAASESYRQNSTAGSDWSRMTAQGRLKHAFFQSITARTAGFNTIDMAELTDAGKLWMCGLMVIGGSPAGTAGGIKTTTFALLLVIVYSVMRRRDEVEVFKRAVSYELIRRVVTSAVMFFTLVGLVTLLLSIAMRPGHAFIDVLFEACSACGTVGLSTGLTPKLTHFGKFVLIAGMFIGRIGVMTVLLAMVTRVRRTTYSYPAESVVIG